MRTPSKREIIRALRLVRERVADGRNRLICSTLTDLADSRQIPVDVELFLRMHIHQMLQAPTYEVWLYRRHRDFYDRVAHGLGDTELVDAFRPGRLAWIDSLIAEFSE